MDCISVGVERMQRNLEPMRKQVEAWHKSELTDVAAKVVIYEAFVEGRLEARKHLARTVHLLYFEPKYEDFPVALNCGIGSSSRNWESSWRPGSRRLFSDSGRYRPDRRFFVTRFAWQALRGSRRFPRTHCFPRSHFLDYFRIADQPERTRKTGTSKGQPRRRL